MKILPKLFVTIAISLLLFLNCSKSPSSPEIDVISNPYLGQASPGNTPELFAPGIFESTDWGITFSPNGGECFFARKVNNMYTIFTTKAANGEWTTPELASLSGTYVNMEPLLTPDGNRLIFKSTRPLPGETSSGFHQWYTEKSDTGWSEPVPMENPFDEMFIEYPTVSDDKNIYYAKLGDIYISKFKNGAYQQPEMVKYFINNLPVCGHPFIAPDESYLIFDSKTQGNSDLFISFRNEDGNWIRPINLGDNFNISNNETTPFVSRDGRYLFFTRLEGSDAGIYWADAQIIKDLKPDNLRIEYAYQTPGQIDDGLITGSMNEAGMNVAPMISLMNDLLNRDDHLVHSILIVKNGKLVFEEYFEGDKFELARYTGEKGFDREDMHNLCSATKSFTSACIGIAMDQGFIQDVNQKVFDFFPEYSDILNNESQKANLTLEHLLTMTSGLDWNDMESSYYDPQNDMSRMFDSSDPMRYILSKPLIRTPGTAYDYQNCNTNVLGGIIHKLTGDRIDKFTEDHLFSKMGIEEYKWQIMPNGAVLASGELRLRPRDMAKFGLLFLNKGKWEGEQIISQDWVELSTQKHISLTGWQWEDGYGYQWWHNTFHSNNNSYRAYFANGWGGQQIYVFKDQNMVVVFTGGNYYANVPNGEILEHYILPTMGL